MRITDIEKRARALGVKNSWKFSKKELVREVQRREGNFDCFATATTYCDQTACCWRSDCLK